MNDNVIAGERDKGEITVTRGVQVALQGDRAAARFWKLSRGE